MALFTWNKELYLAKYFKVTTVNGEIMVLKKCWVRTAVTKLCSEENSREPSALKL